MFDIFEFFKKNRIRLVKIFITVIVFYFLASSLMKLISDFSSNYCITIIQLYSILLIICNFLSEFSPYVLHNYLLYIFPFLSNYFGRGVVYILIGFLFISPSPENHMKSAGWAIIITGVICIWLNHILAKNIQVEYQDFVVMKDNYQDFSSNSNRESYTFPFNKAINNNNNNT
jgi:hypothetical protein